jgi:hypothetical protein
MFLVKAGIIMSLFFLTHQVQGQKILLLEKTTGTKRIRHYEGDSFAFRVDGDKYAIKGNIEMILDYGIVVDGEVYRFDNITMVLNYRKYAVLRALSKSALYAVPPMLVFTLLHNGINTKESPLIDKNTIQVAGVVGGVGLVLWPFKVYKYRLDKKWQLRTIDVTPG